MVCPPAQGRELRRYFRLRYPVGDMGRITIGEYNYQLAEISEGGLRFKVPVVTRFTNGQPISAVIEVHSASQVVVRGVVLRFDKLMREIIVQLTVQGIPSNVIFDEQRYMLQKYHKFLDT